MALFERVFLLSLSMFCSIFVCGAQGIEADADSLLTHRCAFGITMEKGHISGIMVAKEDRGTIIGSMINEFGVSALSFVYDKRENRLKLQDLVSFLNKWYIKRVLKADLTFCLHVLYNTPFEKKHNYKLSVSETGISIANTKRHITYTFQPLNPNIEYETTE